MRLVVALLLLSPTPILAQTWIAPYVVGEYRNDVVFEGEFDATDMCIWADYYEFDFSGLSFPTGIELALVVDEPIPTSTEMVTADNVVMPGDSFIVSPSTLGLALGSITGIGTIRFHITAHGTPIVDGETYSCWVDYIVTYEYCWNTYHLVTGESFAPCEVELPTGIANTEAATFTILSEDGQLIVQTDASGTLDMLDITGRVLHSQTSNRGETTAFHAPSGIVIVRLSNSKGISVRKIFTR
jgi:hypothetical protein